MAIKFSGPAQGALVSITDQFIGVIMPVRLNECDAWGVPGWLKRPETTETEPKSAAVKRPARRPAAKKAS